VALGQELSVVPAVVLARRAGRKHFLLTPGELDLVLKCRGNVNHCGMALLLKTLPG
jgi:hypothetical protein